MTTSEWLIMDIQKHPMAPDLYTIAIRRTVKAPVPGKKYQVKEIPNVFIEVMGEELVNPARRGIMRIATRLTFLYPVDAAKLKGRIIVPKVEDEHSQLSSVDAPSASTDHRTSEEMTPLPPFP